ncbi:MAG: DegV family protein [Oscillospiraceae bacterium]
MDRKFTLSCCSTVDLPYSYMESRDIPVLFYTYVVDGREYDDDMGRDPEALPRFYGFLKEGKLPQTSQINVAAYTEFFEKLLDKGGDVLHIAFTSGQSGSVHNAFLAAEELKDRYPGQRLVVIDSLCSSSGYGLLVDYAADMRDEGKTLDEVAQWVLDNRNKVHHQFFSSDMTQFRRTGRVSGAAATVATVLNICPIMRLDDKGAIKAYSKVRGKKKAVETTVDTMEQCARNGRDYDGKCFVCHSQCPEDARLVIEAVEERFPKLKGKIRLCDIGTIIGSHAGQGTVAVFFIGDERPEME